MLLLKVVTGIFPTSCTHTDKWVQTNKMGGSRKYPYHTTDGLSEFRGQGGGFFELEIRRHGGILTIGIPKACGVSRSGISTGDSQECIP